MVDQLINRMLQGGYNSSRCAAGLLNGRRKKKKQTRGFAGGNFTFLNISVIVWLSGVQGGRRYPTRGILRSSFIFGHQKKENQKISFCFLFFCFVFLYIFYFFSFLLWNYTPSFFLFLFGGELLPDANGSYMESTRSSLFHLIARLYASSPLISEHCPYYTIKQMKSLFFF